MVNVYGDHHMRPQERARGALVPPGRPKKVCFYTFFGKIVSFLLLFRQKVGLAPNLENFCPSMEKKSADAHGDHSLKSQKESVIDLDKSLC